jgi:hypothetical protein
MMHCALYYDLTNAYIVACFRTAKFSCNGNFDVEIRRPFDIPRAEGIADVIIPIISREGCIAMMKKSIFYFADYLEGAIKMMSPLS